VPVAFVSIQIFKEATQLYSSLLSSGGTTGLLHEADVLLNRLGISFFSVGPLELDQYTKQGLGWLIQHLDTVFSRVSMMMIDIFVLLIALYYLFKDGHKLKKSVITLSPLQDVYDETIFRKLELAINSVVRGNLFVGLVQGSLTAIGLTIFGVPNPILWGSITAIAALVPGFGTSLVLVPAVLFLFFTGASTPAMGLFVWWIIAVALVDNVLGPKLVGHGSQLHPFLILLSVLGGVSFFGPLGFLFGPLSLSLLFASLEVHSSVHKERHSS
jgi:predicted PurR-regulated permease PerM